MQFIDRLNDFIVRRKMVKLGMRIRIRNDDEHDRYERKALGYFERRI